VDEAICTQIVAASCSQALVLMGDFNLSLSVGETIQKGLNNPGGSWNILVITSSLK